MALRIDPDPIADADAAEWLRELLTFGRNVGSWMPDRFPRYARILHPAHDWQAPPEQVPSERAVSWAEIASWSGKNLTSRSFIDDIAVRADGTSWNRQNRSLPLEGQFEQPHLDRLTRYLTAATSTPDAVWLLVWSGYGGRGELLVRIGRRQRMVRTLKRRFARRRWVADSNRDLAIEISPSLTGSGRTYILHRGSIDVSTSGEDRARGACRRASGGRPIGRGSFRPTSTSRRPTWVDPVISSRRSWWTIYSRCSARTSATDWAEAAPSRSDERWSAPVTWCRSCRGRQLLRLAHRYMNT